MTSLNSDNLTVKAARSLSPFERAHPYVLIEASPKGLIPRRFASLAGAASTAVRVKCGVRDVRNGKEYSLKVLAIVESDPDSASFYESGVVVMKRNVT